MTAKAAQTHPATSSSPTRLRASDRIRRVLETGVHARGRTVVLHAAVRRHDPSGPVARAVVASRRVGTAVARNRAKRLMREAARTVQWTTGHDLVVIARPGIRSATMDEVARDLHGCASVLGIIEVVG